MYSPLPLFFISFSLKSRVFLGTENFEAAKLTDALSSTIIFNAETKKLLQALNFIK